MFYRLGTSNYYKRKYSSIKTGFYYEEKTLFASITTTMYHNGTDSIIRKVLLPKQEGLYMENTVQTPIRKGLFTGVVILLFLVGPAKN